MKKMFLIAIALLSTPTAFADNKMIIDYKYITQITMEKAILPGHKLFLEKSIILRESIGEVCSGTGLLSNAKQAYLETAMTWAGIEWINFGPVISNDRKMRISFFPDKHKVGSRQIRKAITKSDVQLLSDVAKGESSYALQGLKTLDKILFKYDILKNAYACKLSYSVATNIENMAIEINRAWTEEFGELYGTNVSPEDALENVREIMESSRLFLQVMRDHKLGRALNLGKKVKPTNTEYGSSGYSLLALKVNTLVIYKGVDKALVKVLSASERKRFYVVVKSIIGKIDSAKYSLKDSLKKDKPFVEGLYKDVSVFLILYDKMLNKKFGFKQAFNSLDGD